MCSRMGITLESLVKSFLMESNNFGGKNPKGLCLSRCNGGGKYLNIHEGIP